MTQKDWYGMATELIESSVGDHINNSKKLEIVYLPLYEERRKR